MTIPNDPFAAATHRDPYGYYAGLATNATLQRDAATGLWIAASAAAVEAVLSSPLCRVRPTTAKIPSALVGSTAGRIFGALVRMNDGPGHCPFKQAIAAAFDGLDRAGAVRIAAHEAAALVGGTALAEFPFAMPAHVVAALLGVPAGLRPAVARWTGDFAAAIAATATPEQIARGDEAAQRLLDAVRDRLDAAGNSDDSLLAALARDARRVGCDDAEIIAANAVGFLSQTYDATAGLIGNTLLALAAHPELATAVRADDGALHAFIDEVQRWDPPVQNTRRFVAADGLVAGTPLYEGDAILVVLAAANRDPAANPDPARFDPARTRRRSFTFGYGVHACPGQTLATIIAAAAVRTAIAHGLEPAMLVRPPAYRPSVNARIPLLARKDARP